VEGVVVFSTRVEIFFGQLFVVGILTLREIDGRKIGGYFGRGEVLEFLGVNFYFFIKNLSERIFGSLAGRYFLSSDFGL